MSKTNFEKAQLLFKKIKQEHLETELLKMLQEDADPYKLDFEVMYDDGGRSFLLRPQNCLRQHIIIGVIVDDVLVSVREGMVRCNWWQAKEYSRLTNFADASMHLLPLELDLHKVFYRLNLLLERIEGDLLCLGWYWTDKEVDDKYAWAVNFRTGKYEKWEKTKPLRYRPALKLHKKKYS